MDLFTTALLVMMMCVTYLLCLTTYRLIRDEIRHPNNIKQIRYPDNIKEVLHLKGNDNKLKLRKQNEYLVTINKRIAMKFIKKVYKKVVNSKFITIGPTSLEQEYLQLIDLDSDVTKDHIINLRDSLGIEGCISIIYNDNIRNNLEKKYKFFDLCELKLLLKDSLLKPTIYYTKEILSKRWNIILNLKDPRVVNNSGSYLYLISPIYNVIAEQVALDNIIYQKAVNGVRINLLCSNEQFDKLLEHWRRDLLLDYSVI